MLARLRRIGNAAQSVADRKSTTAADIAPQRRYDIARPVRAFGVGGEEPMTGTTRSSEGWTRAGASSCSGPGIAACARWI
jgi:hypothetical protein